MSKISLELAEALLDAIKTNLDGGFVYIFSGAIPATPSLALDVVTVHTEVSRLSLDNDGVTGLTFSAAADDVISKTPAEVWEGTVSFDGFENAETTLTPTFFRFGAAGDNCRTVSTGMRLQGTVGGPASSADMKLGTADLTDNGTNTTAAASFNVRLVSLA